MTTLREAHEAAARAEGFLQAVEMIGALGSTGISAAAISAALGAQARSLDEEAERLRGEAQAIVDANAEARKKPPKAKAEKAETLPV